MRWQPRLETAGKSEACLALYALQQGPGVPGPYIDSRQTSRMFTYISLGTNDLPRAILFYDAVMHTLGHRRCATDAEDADQWEGWAGWGRYEQLGLFELALWVGKPFNGLPATAGNGTMIAFKADDWQAVRNFHRAAITHGGSSEGAPGLRPHYNPDFYAAYVRDPDGNKLAAVCRGYTDEP